MTRPERSSVQEYMKQEKFRSKLQDSLQRSAISTPDPFDNRLESVQRKIDALAALPEVQAYFIGVIHRVNVLSAMFKHYQRPAFNDGYITKDEFDQKRMRIKNLRRNLDFEMGREFVHRYPEVIQMLDPSEQGPKTRHKSDATFSLESGKVIQGYRAEILQLIYEREEHNPITTEEIAKSILGAAASMQKQRQIATQIKQLMDRSDVSIVKVSFKGKKGLKKGYFRSATSQER